MHYFLPWNLYRLAWLLPGLDLLSPPPEREIHLLDLGSGPLTLPLALWCARPDLRRRPVRLVCADVASRPLEVGRDALRRLAGPDSPWRVSPVRGPLEKALAGGCFHAILAGNILNELRPFRGEDLEDRLERMCAAMFRSLAPDGRIFLVEPGTRLGGSLVALVREVALKQGLHPIAPCPHAGPCPLRAAPTSSRWCHFVSTVPDAPESLLELSRRSRLEKDGLALSCLLLCRAAEQMAGDASRGEETAGGPARKAGAAAGRTPSPAGAFVRILSHPIRLPARPAPARYACSAKGLALVLDALSLPSGGAVRVLWPCPEERDGKTGALILRAW
jgi:hypothetical protein